MSKALFITRSIDDLFEGFKLGDLGAGKPKFSPEIRTDEPQVSQLKKPGKVVRKIWDQGIFRPNLSASWSEIFDNSGYVTLKKFLFTPLERDEFVGRQIDIHFLVRKMTVKGPENRNLYCLEFYGHLNDKTSKHDTKKVLLGYLDVIGQFEVAATTLFERYAKIFTTKGLRVIKPDQWRLTQPIG